MKLSIITICFNNLEGLKRTYLSVVKQTVRKDFEWIVIDGASTDGTTKWLQEHNSDINLWVSEADSGIFNAMNKGIRMAKGEYLLFMNAGDPLNGEDIIAQCLPLLDGTELIYGNSLVYNPATQESYEWNTRCPMRPSDFIFDTIPHQTAFISAKLHHSLLYREDIGIMGDFIFFADAVINHNAQMKKIPFSAGIFYLDGISQRNPEETMRQREIAFRKCFSDWLYEDLYSLDKFYRMPFLFVIKTAAKIRHLAGNLKRTILPS